VRPAAFLCGPPQRCRSALPSYGVHRGAKVTSCGLFVPSSERRLGSPRRCYFAVTYPEAFLGRIAVYSETLDPRSPRSELFSRSQDYPLAEFFKAFNDARWPYVMAGTASLGGQYISRFFNARPPEYAVESGYGILFWKWNFRINPVVRDEFCCGAECF